MIQPTGRKFSSPGMSYSLPLEFLQRPPSGDTIREIVTSQQCVQTSHHTITEEAEPNEEKEIEETFSKGSNKEESNMTEQYGCDSPIGQAHCSGHIVDQNSKRKSLEIFQNMNFGNCLILKLVSGVFYLYDHSTW